MITKINKFDSGTEFVAKFIAPDGTIYTPPSSIAPFSSVAYLFVGFVVDLSASGASCAMAKVFFHLRGTSAPFTAEARELTANQFQTGNVAAADDAPVCFRRVVMPGEMGESGDGWVALDVTARVNAAVDQQGESVACFAIKVSGTAGSYSYDGGYASDPFSPGFLACVETGGGLSAMHASKSVPCGDAGEAVVDLKSGALYHRLSLLSVPSDHDPVSLSLVCSHRGSATVWEISDELVGQYVSSSEVRVEDATGHVDLFLPATAAEVESALGFAPDPDHLGGWSLFLASGVDSYLAYSPQSAGVPAIMELTSRGMVRRRLSETGGLFLLERIYLGSASEREVAFHRSSGLIDRVSNAFGDAVEIVRDQSGRIASAVSSARGGVPAGEVSLSWQGAELQAATFRAAQGQGGRGVAFAYDASSHRLCSCLSSSLILTEFEYDAGKLIRIRRRPSALGASSSLDVGIAYGLGFARIAEAGLPETALFLDGFGRPFLSNDSLCGSRSIGYDSGVSGDLPAPSSSSESHCHILPIVDNGDFSRPVEDSYAVSGAGGRVSYSNDCVAGVRSLRVEKLTIADYKISQSLPITAGGGFLLSLFARVVAADPLLSPGAAVYAKVAVAYNELDPSTGEPTPVSNMYQESLSAEGATLWNRLAVGSIAVPDPASVDSLSLTLSLEFQGSGYEILIDAISIAPEGGIAHFGSNMVPNGYFQSGLSGWTRSDPSVSPDFPSGLDGHPDAYLGERAIRFAPAQSAAPRTLSRVVGADLKKGRVYTFSFGCAANRGSGAVVAKVRLNHRGGGSELLVFPSRAGGGRFALQSFPFAPEEDCSSAEIVIDVASKDGAWVDAVQLIDGGGGAEFSIAGGSIEGGAVSRPESHLSFECGDLARSIDDWGREASVSRDGRRRTVRTTDARQSEETVSYDASTGLVSGLESRWADGASSLKTYVSSVSSGLREITETRLPYFESSVASSGDGFVSGREGSLGPAESYARDDDGTIASASRGSLSVGYGYDQRLMPSSFSMSPAQRSWAVTWASHLGPTSVKYTGQTLYHKTYCASTGASRYLVKTDQFGSSTASDRREYEYNAFRKPSSASANGLGESVFRYDRTLSVREAESPIPSLVDSLFPTEGDRSSAIRAADEPAESSRTQTYASGGSFCRADSSMGRSLSLCSSALDAGALSPRSYLNRLCLATGSEMICPPGYEPRFGGSLASHSPSSEQPSPAGGAPALPFRSGSSVATYPLGGFNSARGADCFFGKGYEHQHYAPGMLEYRCVYAWVFLHSAPASVQPLIRFASSFTSVGLGVRQDLTVCYMHGGSSSPTQCSIPVGEWAFVELYLELNTEDAEHFTEVSVSVGHASDSFDDDALDDFAPLDRLILGGGAAEFSLGCALVGPGRLSRAEHRVFLLEGAAAFSGAGLRRVSDHYDASDRAEALWCPLSGCFDIAGRIAPEATPSFEGLHPGSAPCFAPDSSGADATMRLCYAPRHLEGAGGNGSFGSLGYRLPLEGSLTVGFAFKITSVHPSDTIFSVWVAGSAYGVRFENQTAVTFFGPGYSDTTGSSGMVGQWAYAAATVSAGALKIYVNGTLRCSLACDPTASEAVLRLACRSSAGSAQYRAEGLYRDLFFSTRAMSAAEISSAFTAHVATSECTANERGFPASTSYRPEGGAAFSRQIAYGSGHFAEAGLAMSETLLSGGSISYTRDGAGRVLTAIRKNALGQTVRSDLYSYDSMGRLSTWTLDFGSPVTYTYNAAGDILSKGGLTYSYGQGTGRMTQRSDGVSLSYSSATAGAVSSIVRSGSSHSLGWRAGRLASYGAWSYEYDASGIRVRKSLESPFEALSSRVSYSVSGGRILALERVFLGATKRVFFRYGASGELIGLRYGDAEYFYDRNVLGDILDILDASGHAVVSYSYDPWGKPEMSNDGTTAGQDLMSLNPFLYRGYVYDQESGFYYLMSRYYDPDLCRFLSADDVLPEPGDFSALNPYAYCYNDPINYSDPIGHMPFLLIALLIGAGIIAAKAAVGAIEYAIWDANNWISAVGEDVKITGSWFVPYGISRAVFLALMYSSQKYRPALDNGKRDYFSYMLEWDLHNAAASAFFVAGTVLFIPSLLVSNPGLSPKIWEKFEHARDVDMEGSDTWFERMWGFLFR